AGGHGIAREPVGGGQDAAQVVRGVAPFGGQPGVVEVEPADHGADVEGGLDRVQLEGGAGDLGAVGHDGAGHDGAQQLGAGGVFQRLQAAAQGVDQAVAGGVVGQGAVDRVVQHIVHDVDQYLVGLGTDVGNVSAHCCSGWQGLSHPPSGGRLDQRDGEKGFQFPRSEIGVNVRFSGPT